jgi:hypothetical protein
MVGNKKTLPTLQLNAINLRLCRVDKALAYPPKFRYKSGGYASLYPPYKIFGLQRTPKAKALDSKERYQLNLTGFCNFVLERSTCQVFFSPLTISNSSF